MARRHGFNLITFSTENSWGCQNWWSPPEKERTYGDIDEMCESLIKANPNVLLIPRISANAPIKFKCGETRIFKRSVP